MNRTEEKAIKSYATNCTFEDGKRYQAAIEAIEVVWPEGSGNGPMGLTPDYIKTMPEWRLAYSMSARKNAIGRAFNGVFCKRFKKELSAERDAKRVSIMLGVVA